jgi:hypothetical protein
VITITHASIISEQLERQSVLAIECTIAGDMTIDQWRALSSTRRRSRRRRLRDALQAWPAGDRGSARSEIAA